MCLAEVVWNLLLQNVLDWFFAGWWFEIYIPLLSIYLIYIYMHTYLICVCIYIYMYSCLFMFIPILGEMIQFDSYVFKCVGSATHEFFFCFPSGENTNMWWLWRLLNEWKLVVIFFFFVVVVVVVHLGGLLQMALARKPTHPAPRDWWSMLGRPLTWWRSNLTNHR